MAQKTRSYRTTYRPRRPLAPYLTFLDQLRQGTDTGLHELHNKLTLCHAYRIKTNQRWHTRFGYPLPLCKQPECFHCRYALNGRELDKFHAPNTTTPIIFHPMVESGKVELVPTTINIASHSIDLTHEQILEVREKSRSYIRNIVKKIERRIGTGNLCLYGHLEAADPEPDRTTKLHFHCWIITTLDRDQLRDELVRATDDDPRRINFRYRKAELGYAKSISGLLDYSVKNLQATAKQSPDAEINYQIARFRYYLRCPGGTGTRIKIGVKEMQKTLDEMQSQSRDLIREAPFQPEFQPVSESTSYTTVKSTTKTVTVSSRVSFCFGLSPVSFTTAVTIFVTGFLLGYRSRAPPISPLCR